MCIHWGMVIYYLWGGGEEGELFWESLEHFQNNLQLILATLDTIGYLESIFLNIVNMAILPSPLTPPPGSGVVVSSQEILILELL